MDLLIKIAIISTLSVFLTIAIPGFLLNVIRRKVFNERILWTIDDGVWVIASGFVFNLGIFLLAFLLIHWGYKNQFALSGLMYSLDVILLFWVIVFYRSELFTALCSLGKFLVTPVHLLMFTVITIFCTVGMHNYPHTLDSGQLKWTLKLLDSLTFTMADSTGAAGFSALIYFPAALFKSIPLVTLSAGLKIAFGWLFVFGIIYLVEKINFTFKSLFKIGFFAILLSSSFAFFSLYQYGKDSVLAVLFSMLYLGTLFEETENYNFYFRSGLLLLCTIVTGVITIPYMFLITLTYFVVKLTKFDRPFLFLFYLFGLSSIGLILSFGSMMKISSVLLVLMTLFTLGVLFFLRNINFKEKKYHSALAVVFPFLLSSLLIILYYLMPIKIPVHGGMDALGHAPILFYPPIDGKTTFIQFLNLSRNMSFYFIELGVMGMLLFIIDNKYRQKDLLYSLSLFPFLVMLLVILCGHLKNSPFTGFNLWDLSRDVTAYYHPYIMGIFSLILVEIIFIKKFLRFPMFQGFLATVPILIILTISSTFFQFFIPAQVTFTEIGGDQNKTFAYATNALVQNRFDAKSLFIDKDSSGFRYIHSYQMYSNLIIFPIGFDDADITKSFIFKKPYLFVMNQKNITKLTDLAKRQNKSVTCLQNFVGTDSGLYEVS